MLYNFRDQSYTTAVTTSTFPNMHTFLNGPELCFMIRKLFSSCRTSKNITLNEQYNVDGMVCLILNFQKSQREAREFKKVQAKKLVKFFFSWNCIFGSFKLFPSSKIDFWPFLKLQNMEFGLNKISWNWFIRFHEFFGLDFFKYSGPLCTCAV